MIDFKKNWIKISIFILLFIGSMFLVYIQIDRAQTATKLELALINAIQYLLSIGFTWLLAMVVFENSQKEKQRRFAIAAFRRIKEIERNIIRTHNYVSNSLRIGDDISGCLKVVQSTLLNVQDTIRSSIYDWADVIEDEIELAQEIEKLEKKQSNLLDEESNQQFEQKKIERLIHDLSNKLPLALRESVKIKEDEKELIKKASAYLKNEMISKDCIGLQAFWEPEDSFMKKPEFLKNGDDVYIARGFTDKRKGAILAYDKDGNSIGVVTNGCSSVGAGYEIFVEAMDNIFSKKMIPKLFGGNPINAKVLKINNINKGSDRQYFDLIIPKIETNLGAKNI